MKKDRNKKVVVLPIAALAIVAIMFAAQLAPASTPSNVADIAVKPATAPWQADIAVKPATAPWQADIAVKPATAPWQADIAVKPATAPWQADIAVKPATAPWQALPLPWFLVSAGRSVTICAGPQPVCRKRV